MSEESIASSTADAKKWWRALAERERVLLLFAAALLLLALLWFVAVQPAWRTLARAPAESDALDQQLQTMQQLASEVQQLRAAPAVSPQQAAAAIKSASERLGDKAKLSLQGERAVLTLSSVSTSALRDFLAEARAGARARPLEATLSRTPAGHSGSLVLGLGAGQ